MNTHAGILSGQIAAEFSALIEATANISATEQAKPDVPSDKAATCSKTCHPCQSEKKPPKPSRAEFSAPAWSTPPARPHA